MQPHRWERDRLATALYAAGAARAWVGRPLARLLWRADVRRFYGERRRLLDLPQDALVLDVPCGAGALFPRPAASALPGPRHVALDVSDLMLGRGRRAAGARHLVGVRFVRADAHRLPFAASTFDLVITHNGLHCYTDPSRAARELARVLKPGGTVRGSAIVTGAGRRPDLMIEAALRLGMFQYRLDQGEVARWLRSAGLQGVSVERSGAVLFFSAYGAGAGAGAGVRGVPAGAPPGAPGCPAG